MLKKVRINNFKSFKDTIELDLTAGNFEFNKEAVSNGIVNKGIIYGYNACGKSNLGFAITDIVTHLTDKQILIEKYQPFYLNYDSEFDYASFDFFFEINGVNVEYHYTKFDFQLLKTEKLIIDDITVIDYDFVSNEGYCNLKGTANLRINSNDGRLSKLKYVKNNAILEETEINKTFLDFMDFVDRMLFFYSLDERKYQGLLVGAESVDDAIVKAGKLKDFERFLHKAEVHEVLSSISQNETNIIIFKHKKGNIPFNMAASTGSKSLELFYYWFIKLSQASFVYMDEFDAFYHYELSELIIKEILKLSKTQIILTTHNTDLLSNDILRPDCYYLMSDNQIKAINNLTKKELRQAHNIQKMFKAGAFND